MSAALTSLTVMEKVCTYSMCRDLHSADTVSRNASSVSPASTEKNTSRGVDETSDRDAVSPENTRKNTMAITVPVSSSRPRNKPVVAWKHTIT